MFSIVANPLTVFFLLYNEFFRLLTLLLAIVRVRISCNCTIKLQHGDYSFMREQWLQATCIELYFAWTILLRSGLGIFPATIADKVFSSIWKCYCSRHILSKCLKAMSTPKRWRKYFLMSSSLSRKRNLDLWFHSSMSMNDSRPCLVSRWDLSTEWRARSERQNKMMWH